MYETFKPDSGGENKEIFAFIIENTKPPAMLGRIV